MASNIAWGATPQQWDRLCEEGLTEDLLPVVSRKDAVVSAQSKLKEVGKTPSKYNREGFVSGIADWTNYKATPQDIDEWKQQRDYGICIQTRNVRAFDIDTTDPKTAEAIAEFLAARIKVFSKYDAAIRWRENSPKCLLPVRVEGEHYKKTVKVPGGMVELLANGQQFVAFGMHPSMTRYKWKNKGFPQITPEQYAELWEDLCDTFGIEPPSESRKRLNGETIDINDPIIEQLDVLDFGSDGQAFIECPFKDEHTTESSESATAYFPAGTNGYAKGHFKCMHAHCAHRTDQDFMDALGVDLCQFEPIPVSKVSSSEPLPLPSFRRDKNSGQPIANVVNLKTALTRPDICRVYIARDKFKEQTILRDYNPVSSESAYRELKDSDYFNLRLTLEQLYSFKPIPAQMMREAVHAVAEANAFDSAQLWLDAQVWDAVERCERFFIDYYGAKDTPYTRACGLYTWTAAAGRVITPGVKADMVPVLISRKQGTGKSTGIMAMAPTPDQYVEISLDGSEDDRARRTKGCLIGEIGELRGFYNSSLEAVKAYVTRQFDKWTPKYLEQPVTYKRRIFFVGTSNHMEIFTDTTGNRRWLPIEIVQGNVERIKRDCNQLWAEGAMLYSIFGVMHREAEKLADALLSEYTINDPWLESIQAYLFQPNKRGELPTDKGYVTTQEILTEAIGMTRAATNTGFGRRIGEIMRPLGYVPKQVRMSGDYRARAWVLDTTSEYIERK